MGLSLLASAFGSVAGTAGPLLPPARRAKLAATPGGNFEKSGAIDGGDVRSSGGNGMGGGAGGGMARAKASAKGCRMTGGTGTAAGGT